MLRRRTLLAATATLACGRTVARRRPHLAETRDTVLDFVESWRERLPVAGVSVALVDRGELAWAIGAGPADHEARRLAGPETMYAIGSLTKPITALTALHVVARGLLDLDAPLHRHLPELGAVGAAAITARQLLCHRSGLLSDWHRGGLGAKLPDWRQVAGEVAGEPLVAPPDTWMAYSNIGYTVLGRALERICGRRWESLVAEALEAAVGPTGFTFERPATLAATYFGGVRMVEPRVRLAPAAGMLGSVLDLAALLRWLLAGEGAAAEMLTPQRAGPLDFDERWGLGLGLHRAGLAHAGRVAWHTGRTYGHRGALVLLPDRGLGVAVLANFREASRVDELAVVALQTALLERDGLDVPRRRGDAELPPPAPVDVASLLAHAGRYATDNDIITAAVEDGALSLRSDTGETRLIPAPGGGFVSADAPDTRVRLLDRAGHHVLTSTVGGVETRVGVRCPEDEVPPAWLARLGTYQVEAAPEAIFTFKTAHLERLGAGFHLRLAAPQPFGQAPTLARYALAAIDGHAARTFGVGRGKGQQMLAHDGPDGPALQWAGCRLVRVAS